MPIPPNQPERTSEPFACDPTALTPQARKRHFDVLDPALRARKKSVRELRDGFEFEFPSDAATVQLVSEWAAAERLCCPFFDIELHVEREGASLCVRLTGREGVKQFIQAELARWFQV
jgi:hypothetical protein